MARPMRMTWLAALAAASLLVGCGAERGGGEPVGEEPQEPISERPVEPGEPVSGEVPEPAEAGPIRQGLQQAMQVDAQALLKARELPFGSLSYDPSQAEHLSLIQSSNMQLTSDEMMRLGANGFVISGSQEFPSFTYGYHSIYMQDLPLYVSADSILYAVHRSYDDILKAVELEALIPELALLLEGMRNELQRGAAAGFGAQATADADFYLAVALSLLQGQQASPVAGADGAKVTEFVAAAEAHQGMQVREIFGVERRFDFSQFEPRGHYTDDVRLERYFRAMKWLGRIDMRILEPDENTGELVFHRHQLELAYLLRALVDGRNLERWGRIERAIAAFVGEQDNMTLEHLDRLLKELQVSGPGDVAGLKGEDVARVLASGTIGGEQKILGHILINGVGEGTMPLSSNFLLFGERYVVDSHVFSNVVYDRVKEGQVKRMMPDPLDAAFGALANDQAVALLHDDLMTHDYAAELNGVRYLVDAYRGEFWEANLYNRWLSALRALSPGGWVAAPKAAGKPEVTGTEIWGRRILNTQMASWAELRHDTILYAKQSYTAGAACEYPDAYVEPYPEFFAAVGQMAAHGQRLVEELELDTRPSGARVAMYFSGLQSTMEVLGEMAQLQANGEPFTEAHMAFINEAVTVQQICGGAHADGWYPRLFFHGNSAVEFDPTIADVHTQPTDEGGAPVGKVLHVGTGMARAMVVTVDTCEGPKAYVGLASSYYEKVTSDFERLDDEQWKGELGQQPGHVDWLAPAIAP